MKFRASCCLCLWAIAGASARGPSHPVEMVRISSGIYYPLFAATADKKGVVLRPFYLDALPVTVGDYLAFVRANPQWQRSHVKRIFADRSYLSDWAGDLTPGTNAPTEAPVTRVSWFAARAYAQWTGKRLPTTAEWEYAASASPTRPDGRNDALFQRKILQWYTTPSAPLTSVKDGEANFWGAKDLHGLIWEWTLDFNASPVDTDAAGSFCGAASQGAREVGDYPAFMRTGFRSSLKANYCVHNLGFRCARDL